MKTVSVKSQSRQCWVNEEKVKRRGRDAQGSLGFFESTHLHAGHRKKAYGVSGVIHLFDKQVLSNYYVLKIMTDIGDTGTRGAFGIE